MALSSCVLPAVIEDSSLTDWKVIGSGGFGQIFKARHHRWCCDVAVKLLHYDDGTSESLLREINMMRQGSNPYVIQVLGVFKGRLPSSGPSTHLGLVMEVMERGSLHSLQKTLCRTPPWPLVFRLAHQVALGINFLHNLTPALLHLDLKPSNVLLDSSLNAKLTDFGLARFYHSVSRRSTIDSDEEAGTISYMPPEAFHISYRPSRASDIYSYGILLWSIVTGKQPYEGVFTSLVRLRIPEGDRPLLDWISSQAVGLAGLTGLMNLMERCWDAKPNNRPSSHTCTTETEELYKLHKCAILDAVHQVLKKLDEKEEESVTGQFQRDHITQASVSRPTRAEAVYDDTVLTGGPPVQEMDGGWPANQRVTARVKDQPAPRAASACDDDPKRSSLDHKVKVSSVHPIQAASSTGRPPQGKAAKTLQQTLRQNLISQYHRQSSSPHPFPYNPPPAVRGVHMYLSNVTGLQHGHNNTMHIYTADLSERRRHPTAPSRVNLPPPHGGSRRDEMGGAG